MSQQTRASPVKEAFVVARQHFLHCSKRERRIEVKKAPIAVSSMSWKMINHTNAHWTLLARHQMTATLVSELYHL